MLDILFKEMDFSNPRAGQVSQSCLEAGTCDYGIYPLKNRFYMDQVPLDLFQYGKVSLNPKGAGFCWNSWQNHDKQKKGQFVEQQKELVRRITAQRARALKVTGIWCRITMKKLVQELGDESGAKTFKASSRWLLSFRKRWGFTFQEKTNGKKNLLRGDCPT